MLGTIAATAAGCGGDDDGGGGSGGEGGAGSTTTSTVTTSTGLVTSTSTGSGNVDDGNDSIDEAEEIPAGNNGLEGTLEPLEEDADYYSFTGTKGQPVYLISDAKPEDGERDPTYPDTVITLLDADGNQIAQNDDPEDGFTNDSELLTVLPADGEYFIVVQDCNAAFPDFAFPNGCFDPAEVVSFDYSLRFLPIDPAASETDSLVGETEPNNGAELAGQMPYELNQDESAYYTTFVFGSFGDEADVDVYSFTPPATPEVDNALLAQLSVSGPSGPEGNGSTVEVSEVAVFNATDLTSAYAKIDPSTGGDIAVPVEAGQEYFVFVKRPAGEVGKNDFYILLHSRTSSDPLEAEDATNGDVATPEGGLVSFPNGGGGVSFAIEGKLADSEEAPDVDVYEVPLDDVEEGWTISVICGAQRHGSGVRELRAEVLNGDGTEIGATHSATETEEEDLFIESAAIPEAPEGNRLLVRVSAGTPAADVTSRGYNCLFAYLPPAAN
ncbi:pre-peptidase C-terminal domain-containing protein [Sorangium sp. So ce134]